MATVQKFETELLKKCRAAKNTYTFFFERPREFNFLPGQFMRLTLEISQTDGRGNHRFFSIASAPTEKDYLMITTRSNHSAFKKTLISLPIKSKVQISGPYGVFILKPEETSPHIFLAGGIGITPFRSMIVYASDMNLSIPIILFTSFSTVEEIVFQKELQEIATRHPWFRLVETITQPDESKTPWRGIVGRIDSNLIKKYLPELSSSLFYIAGPPEMVEAIDNLVKSLQVDDSRIRKEKFSGY